LSSSSSSRFDARRVVETNAHGRRRPRDATASLARRRAHVVVDVLTARIIAVVADDGRMRRRRVRVALSLGDVTSLHDAE
jgi:hypothetical protein